MILECLLLFLDWELFRSLIQFYKDLVLHVKYAFYVSDVVKEKGALFIIFLKL